MKKLPVEDKIFWFMVGAISTSVGWMITMYMLLQ